MDDHSKKCESDCIYCHARDKYGDIGNTERFIKALGNRLDNRTVLETANFAVIASIGSPVDGCLTIVAKQHFISMSHLPLDYYDELEKLMLEIRKLLSSLYAQPFYFEHGPMPTENNSKEVEGGGFCVDHAHIHAVPIYVDVANILKACFHHSNITDLIEINRRAIINHSYIFLEDQDRRRYVFDAQLAPSQCVRRIIFTLLGIPDEWNWRIYENWGKAFNTLIALNTAKKDGHLLKA